MRELETGAKESMLSPALSFAARETVQGAPNAADWFILGYCFFTFPRLGLSMLTSSRQARMPFWHLFKCLK